MVSPSAALLAVALLTLAMRSVATVWLRSPVAAILSRSAALLAMYMMKGVSGWRAWSSER